MCDIEMILKSFENDLNSKKQEEKIAYLQSFGFRVSDKKVGDDLQSKKVTATVIVN